MTNGGGDGYGMELNKIHHMDFLKNTLPDKCAKLMICDPPYYRVKGEFDFIWKTFADYLADVEKWAVECKRLLADNGTLFWWGNSKKIAYSQIILDKHFNLENSIVWRKTDSMQYQYYSPDLARTFNTHNERLLMYSNEIIRTGLEEIKLDVNNFKGLREYFKGLQAYIPHTKIEITNRIGQKADHCFRHGSTQWDLPTKETYAELITAFKIDSWTGYKEYETLRQEYETLRRFFRNDAKLEEVLEFSQNGHNTKNYDHETQKSETLTRSLILTCSRKGDLVVVTFSGSGTECAMSAKEGRPFIGFDVKKKYVDMGNERCDIILSQPELSLTAGVQEWVEQ